MQWQQTILVRKTTSCSGHLQRTTAVAYIVKCLESDKLIVVKIITHNIIWMLDEAHTIRAALFYKKEFPVIYIPGI